MTLKNLHNLDRIIDSYSELLGYTVEVPSALEQLKGLPFYSDWNKESKNILDFNHTIDLPEKNGVAYPLFDYERLLFDSLQNHKHLWVQV